MRTLSVSTEWLKLREPEFTTFKLPRKNKNWDVGEIVKVVYKLQSKEREKLGIAKIIDKEQKILKEISEEEARNEGFLSVEDMIRWAMKRYNDRIEKGAVNIEEEAINKLKLKWIHGPFFDFKNRVTGQLTLERWSFKDVFERMDKRKNEK